jgi:hypothetical protein
MNDLSMKRVGGALVILGVVTYVACFVSAYNLLGRLDTTGRARAPAARTTDSSIAGPGISPVAD